MSNVRLSSNGKSPPSWYQSNWRVKDDDYKKYDDGWDWDASQSGQPRTDRTERAGSFRPSEGAEDPGGSQSGAKKTETRGEHFKVSSDDLWKVRAKLDGKKSSLSKTYKTTREMNDKVYELNQKMTKHIETLAVLCENFEQAYQDKKEAEDIFDKEF